MNETVKTESIKFPFTIGSTLIGVLLALLINTWVDEKKEVSNYISMVKAINIEANTNRNVLEQSFLPNWKYKIIMREFNLKASNEFISNNIFIKHTSPYDLNLLTQYYLSLQRANNMRDRDEKFKYDTLANASWLQQWRKAFPDILDQCKNSISNVISFSDSARSKH